VALKPNKKIKRKKREFTNFKTHIGSGIGIKASSVSNHPFF
jgi:hypothetical protein